MSTYFIIQQITKRRKEGNNLYYQNGSRYKKVRGKKEGSPQIKQGK